MRQVDLAAIRQQCNTRDEMVGIETARLRELLDALEQAEVLLQQACSVCACGCPESEHENYGEDGEACEHEQHQCVRTSRSVRTMLGQAEQQNTELRAELAGRLSDAFRSIPTRYDTPADHYREMARRVVADRDALKRLIRPNARAKKKRRKKLVGTT